MRWSLPLVLGACVPMEPSGNVLAPVPSGGGAGPIRPARALGGPQGDFDFESEDREPTLLAGGATARDPAAPQIDPVRLQAKLLGVSEEEAARLSTPPPPPASTGALGGLAIPPPAAPIWDPSVTIPEASFGIRVLAVVLDLQPPRAVIALADGREQVVTPGAMLPGDGLVVLAIGRDAVQIAKITPSGFYARVETDTIRALYPQQTTSAP